MIDPHIHCGECSQPIATKIKCAGGKTKDVNVRYMQRPRVIPTPDGKLAVVPVNVPLCETCVERIQAQLQAQQAPSKLIVPGLSLVKNGGTP